MEGVLPDPFIDTGAQIHYPFGPGGFFGKPQGHVPKTNVPDIAGLVSIDQDSVFSGAINVFKGDVMDMPQGGVLLALQSSYGDGLGLAPPVIGRKQPGIDVQAREGYILYTALVPKLEGNSPVASTDVAVLYRNISERSLALRAEFDGGAGGDQGTV